MAQHEEPDRDPSEQLEYATMLLQGDLMTALNHAGRKGWDVFQIVEQPDGSISGIAKRKPAKIQLATELPSKLSIHRR